MCTDTARYQAESTDKTSCCTARKKLWQLDSPFHCSIIGTCLSLGDLRRLCRKMQISLKVDLTDYELHRAFVGIAGKQTYASLRLHKYLGQKYRATIRYFAKAQDEAALETLWDEAVESGDIASTCWALVTHPRAPDALLNRVYGEVHMLSHLAGGATVRVDMQELARLQQLTRTFTRKLADTESKAQDLKAAHEQLASLENDPLSRWLSSQVETVSLKLAAEQARAERAEVNAQTWKKMAVENGDRHLRLEGYLAEVHTERDVLEATLAKLLSPECSACSTQEGCLGDINLCGRCILYVGGRSLLCAHFRALVERQNGQFIHHDGACTVDGRGWDRSCRKSMRCFAHLIVSAMTRRTGSSSSANVTGKN